MSESITGPIAITGHRGLTPQVEAYVDARIRSFLTQYPVAAGISCLADGADQIFARAIIDAGSALVAVIPAAKYRAGLPESCHDQYDQLLAAASQVHKLDYEESDSDAHMAASEKMLDLAGHLIAVWDGQPPRGPGGTADVINEANRRAIPVTIIWPTGATR